MKTALISLAAALLTAGVLAHPGGHGHVSAHELERRQIAANDRHLRARSCAGAINSFHAKRREIRRSLAKRDAEHHKPGHPHPHPHSTHPHPSSSLSGTVVASSTSSAIGPHYTTIQNTTCITAPEVTEGPYYVRNELVRQDLREDQPGVTLVLDIGVLDINTCSPIADVYVDIWSANATGHYSEFTTLNGGGGPRNGTNSTIPIGPPPGGNGTTPGNGTAGPPRGGSQAPSDQLSWLRGGSATDKEGIVELTTIYPGFYSGRTIHIHTALITNWTQNANGTLLSSAGQLRHIGQFFFDEDLNNQVLATSAYLNNTQQHTFNTNDGILDEENSHGYNAFLDTELLGETVEDGILGYITIGVDTKAQYQFNTGNYWNP